MHFLERRRDALDELAEPLDKAPVHKPDAPVRGGSLSSLALPACVCESRTLIQLLSTSLTLRTSAAGVNGFCKNAMPVSSMPWRRTLSSV
jgi:hypothetical protein